MFHVPAIAKVCAYQAAQKYAVPYGEMLGILHTEGGGYDVIDYDSNGTEDLGWAQINSVHLPWLHRYGITREVLLTNPCVNISIGAYILRTAYDDTGNWFTAAEGYNAGVNNLPAGYGYAQKVFLAWRQYAHQKAPNYTVSSASGLLQASYHRWVVISHPRMPRKRFLVLTPNTLSG